jgi:hypothetical protein
MPRIRLTKSAIDALPTTQSDVMYWDDRSRNDDCCLNGSPYDAACWDANVQAYD